MATVQTLQGASGKLLRRIHRACRPSLDEPNVALNLEICDLINDKQGNLPREAAVTVVKLVNSRDAQVAELALSLLDYMVKNCGYPIHLQISRKEFLNELVKKFPERPPPSYTRTQRLILGTISEWVQTICKTSRYKEDLGYIRDMYRLLRSKGYDFPSVKREDAAVLNPSDNLKSIQEIQREERLAQSAKLQELVRRGRPQDLKEANDLMKIMSGFKEDESYEETRQQVHGDLNKLGRKADILDEMLNNISNTGQFNSNDETLNELISALKVSQPKLQTLIQEESDDQEQVGKILSLNDRINSILEKCNYLKNGDTASASKINIGSANKSNSLNLIDFDDDTPETTPNATGGQSSNDAIADLLGDLGGLSFNGSSSGQQSQQTFGAINLLSTPSQTRDQSPAVNNFDLLSGLSSTTSAPAPAPVSTQPVAASRALDPFSFDFLSSGPSTSPAPTVSKTAPLQTLNTSANLQIQYSIISKTPTSISVQFNFSNLSFSELSSIQFSIAVTKQFELTLRSPTGSRLSSQQVNGFTQDIIVNSKTNEPISAVKVKFKCGYVSNGATFDDSGVATIMA